VSCHCAELLANRQKSANTTVSGVRLEESIIAGMRLQVAGLNQRRFLYESENFHYCSFVASPALLIWLASTIRIVRNLVDA
jgi:hypothetical protein